MAARRQLTAAADVVRLGILLIGVAALADGDWDVALKALLLLPPTLCARLVRVNPAFDLLFATALGAEALTSSLGTYDGIAWGDSVSHLVLPLLSGPVVYVALLRLGAGSVIEAGPLPRRLALAGMVTFSAVLMLGVLWEIVEWTADEAVGTNYSAGYEDTINDLRMDTIAAVGAAALVVWLRTRAAAPLRSAT